MLYCPYCGTRIGTILAPWMAALEVVAAIATKCTIVVERREEAPKGVTKSSPTT